SGPSCCRFRVMQENMKPFPTYSPSLYRLRTDQHPMESTLLRNSQRLRVIYTTNYSPWSRYFGGGQLSTHHLACGMARLGHDVHVIYSKAPLETPPVPSGLPYKLHWASLPGFRSSRSMPLRPLVAHSVCRIAEELIAG